MARLTTKQRNALPDSAFAGPGRSYPVEDETHARNAKSRAAQFASPAEKARIDAKADKVLGIKEGSARDKKIDRSKGIKDKGPAKKKAAPKKMTARRRKG